MHIYTLLYMNALASLPLIDEFCDQLHKFFQLKLSFLYFVFLNVSWTIASLPAR